MTNIKKELLAIVAAYRVGAEAILGYINSLDKAGFDWEALDNPRTVKEIAWGLVEHDMEETYKCAMEDEESTTF